MAKIQPYFNVSRDLSRRKNAMKEEITNSIPVENLSFQCNSWVLSCDISQHSERTLSAHREILAKLQ